MRTAKLFSLVLLGLLVGIIAGCFKTEMEIIVKPDGSGTIKQTVGMKKEMIAQMKAMTKSFQGQDKVDLGEENTGDESTVAPDEGADAFSEKSAREAAGQFGEGVEFKSFSKREEGGMLYFTSEYTFKDITKLKIKTNQSESALGDQGGGMPGGPSVFGLSADKDSFLWFSFNKSTDAGGESELVIKLPFAPDIKDKMNDKVNSPLPTGGDKNTARIPFGEKGDESLPPAPIESGPEADPAQMEMAKQIFQDMAMSISVVCAGDISETNATFKDGNKITLMEMNFGQMMQNMEGFQKLEKAPEDLQSAKELMKNMMGFKMELEEEVKVRFK